MPEQLKAINNVSIANVSVSYDAFLNSIGKLFTIGERKTIGTQTSIYLSCQTGSKYATIRTAELNSTIGNIQMDFYEDATITAETGTALNIVNQNRNSTQTIEAVGLYNPTVTDEGTLLHSILIGGGTGGPTSQGFSNTTQRGWKLKPNTVYILKITNPSTSTPANVGYDITLNEDDISLIN